MEPNKKRKRDTWAQSETDDFIYLIKEKNIIQKMDTKKYRSDNLYDELASEMQKKTGPRTASSVKTSYQV